MSATTTQSAVGFTVKSGWACAVVVTGTPSSPRIADSRRVELGDPGNPRAAQPYHAGFATARKAGRELTDLVASVRRFGQRSVTHLIRFHESGGHDLRGAGIVVGSLVDPSTIANDHIRIHALEGQLFRGIVKEAAERHKLAASIWRERDLYGMASAKLKRSEADLKSILTTLGRGVDGSWRAEHKAAALAGWLVLADVRDPNS